MKSQKGVSLLEMVIAMAIFSAFLLIIGLMTRDYARLDRSVRLRWFTHPDDMAVVARLRRDVLDSHGYPSEFQGKAQGPTTLLLSHGGGETIVWNFEPARVERTEWEGASLQTRWVARATRSYQIDSFEMSDGNYAVHLTGRTEEGEIAIDRVLAPRPE